MQKEHKIAAALVVLLGLGGALYATKQSKTKEMESRSPTAAAADLPTIAVPKDDIERITKVEIKNAEKTNVTLEKKGETWEVTAPVQAKANATNVRSMLDNLKELKVKETIDRSANLYGQYDLTDEKAVHVVAYKGAEKALDLWLGKSGSRGQMARVGGKDGVYIAGGYSAFLYTREVKNWRETSILKFEDANAVQIEVKNKNGLFSFSKNGDKWAGTYAKREKDGKIGAPEKKWEKFDEAKVKDLLRAYKGLNAEDFADAKADAGLDATETEGGTVKIVLKDNAGDLRMKIGKVAKGSSRYAAKEDGDGTVYVVSSWAADWATAEAKKFEKSDAKDKDKKADHGDGDDDAPGDLAPILGGDDDEH